ncbi:energy transducer TonB [Flavobacterium terrisoli]|uniref:energy transducer TonB n=1 Tax=Flavobacterium terrisoli TaxID=3242195 RepID=UPI002542785C|nr:energy transducer TonB [Flavobacterium buctense]
METEFKITIPKPCHEDWNAMTPDETGRFCNSCAKSVVDFTGMKTSEIQDYFIKNQGQKVCGRFQNEQLDSIIIQIPREVLFSQVQFHKMFMLALLVSMGTTLFSCQNSNGDKQAIDKVEVVNSIHGRQTVGEPMPEKTTKCETDTVKVKTNTSNNNKKTVSNKGVGTITGDIITSGVVAIEPHNTKPIDYKNDIFPAGTVEVKPNYPGGIAKFYEYFNSNFNVSKENQKSGRIIASFVVDTDGSLIDVYIIRGVNEISDRETAKVLRSSPKWIPGEQDGQKVKVSYALPLKITAQE